MLKISLIEPADHAVTLRLEGRVIGPWVTELRKSCEKVLMEGRPLKLHLADVEFMDAAALTLMASLRSRGVAFVDCPPFLAEQLRGAAISPVS
jgi:anti-anti-sigma regulatory factor